MKKRRLGFLTALIVIMVLGSLYGINRIRADDQSKPPGDGSVILDVCLAPSPTQQQEDPPPCVEANAGDAQAYSFGTTCLPTAATAAPSAGNNCQFPLPGPTPNPPLVPAFFAITIAFSNPNSATTPFALQMFVSNGGGVSTNLGAGANNCRGTADFTTLTNNVCPDLTFGPATAGIIRPGHCTATLGCTDPIQGIFTISGARIFPFFISGVNTLELDIVSGSAVNILGIQVIMEF